MRRVTPYMVFLLLTAMARGSYSYINLFPPSPATDGVLPDFRDEGIRVVNRVFEAAQRISRLSNNALRIIAFARNINLVGVIGN